MYNQMSENIPTLRYVIMKLQIISIKWILYTCDKTNENYITYKKSCYQNGSVQLSRNTESGKIIE
jgi:hypothetical protein